MMRLPDFSKCIEIQELLRAVGAEAVKELPDFNFTRKVRKTEVVQIDNSKQFYYAKKLKAESIPLHVQDNISFDNGIIQVNNVKCCVYIKEQREQYFTNGRSGYKYHLCCCEKIMEMIEDGRAGRYVATSRDDGLFPVTVQSSVMNSYREDIIPLGLCKFCINILESKGMYFTPFSLREFFHRFQPQIQEFINIEKVRVIDEQHVPDHTELERIYTEAAGNICALCGVNCSQYKNLLHLHYKDGCKQNYRASNLMVLCHDCYANQTLHSDLKKRYDYKDKISLVDKLREEQGITSIKAYTTS